MEINMRFIQKTIVFLLLIFWSTHGFGQETGVSNPNITKKKMIVLFSNLSGKTNFSLQVTMLPGNWDFMTMRVWMSP